MGRRRVRVGVRLGPLQHRSHQRLQHGRHVSHLLLSVDIYSYWIELDRYLLYLHLTWLKTSCDCDWLRLPSVPSRHALLHSWLLHHAQISITQCLCASLRLQKRRSPSSVPLNLVTPEMNSTIRSNTSSSTDYTVNHRLSPLTYCSTPFHAICSKGKTRAWTSSTLHTCWQTAKQPPMATTLKSSVRTIGRKRNSENEREWEGQEQIGEMLIIKGGQRKS